ncbi:short chain oxidoreductase/dehydrogenase [Venturia nashicola]|uniref:Short chain oxidoreductase/dehydrogenase n=1 Tax=Venturia nashicola TaxID=86259 RepID=A0A4Z1NZV4_9PEZI|nr:short chain oxidoreductase/dehydrogenase [Venturia nashicola]TLD29845.1 short chain oxidoreductase/dehydrogenase [Venturia nashicola]
MTPFEKHTFLITGVSSGLGLAIALEALQLGHKTAGGAWIQLDLTSPTAQEIRKLKVEAENVDVLVNNAGYGLYGSLEDMRFVFLLVNFVRTANEGIEQLSKQEIRDQMETNFFGALKIIKGAVPHFLKSRKGTIVNMSSISGLTVTSASGIMYSSTPRANLPSKPFPRVCFAQTGLEVHVAKLSNYAWITRGRSTESGKEDCRVVTGTGMGANKTVSSCLRLPLGNDAMDKARDKSLKSYTESRCSGRDRQQYITQGRMIKKCDD